MYIYCNVIWFLLDGYILLHIVENIFSRILKMIENFIEAWNIFTGRWRVMCCPVYGKL